MFGGFSKFEWLYLVAVMMQRQVFLSQPGSGSGSAELMSILKFLNRLTTLHGFGPAKYLQHSRPQRLIAAIFAKDAATVCSLVGGQLGMSYIASL